MNAMKTITSRALTVLALSLVASHAALAALPIQQWNLANGARVWLVESHGIPMVDVQVDFDAGARRDPAGKSGLASVTARMTSKGIAAGDGAALDENQLSEAWADLGGSFGGGASADRMSFTMRSLTYPDLLPKAVQLAARQLGEPSFPEAVWLRAWYGDAGYASIRGFVEELKSQVRVIDAREWLPAESFADGHHMTPTAADDYTRRLATEVAR